MAESTSNKYKYSLKVNNRKKMSGTTIQAKIVSPDCSSFAYKKYPVLIDIQDLTNQEAVIRDKQVVETLLNANNTFIDLQEPGIVGLSDALISAQNRSTIVLTSIIPVQDNGVTYIDAHSGTLLTRPLYDPDNNTDFNTTLSIKISRDEAGSDPFEANIVTPIIIKSYSADSIISELQKLSADDLWTLIKNQNTASDFIFSNLKNTAQINVDTALKTVLGSKGIAIASKYDSSKASAIPTIEIEYPNLYVKDDNDVTVKLINNGSVTIPEVRYCRVNLPTNIISTSITYQEIMNDPGLVKALFTDAANTYQGINLNTTSGISAFNAECSQNLDMVVCYGISEKESGSNSEVHKIIGTWSLNGTRAVSQSLTTRVLSKIITRQNLIKNIEDSIMPFWFLPSKLFNTSDYKDQLNSNLDGASLVFGGGNGKEFEVHVADNCIPLVRLCANPYSFIPASNTTASSSTQLQIVDSSHIGYEIDTLGQKSGFGANTFYFDIKAIDATTNDIIDIHFGSPDIGINESNINGTLTVAQQEAGSSNAATAANGIMNTNIRSFYLTPTEFATYTGGVIFQILVKIKKSPLGDQTTLTYNILFTHQS